MKDAKLPKQIFVYWQQGNPTVENDRYLSAQETTRGIEDGDKVGIYRLVEVKTKKVTEELV